MELDHAEAVRLFMDKMAQLPPDSIVERLQFNDLHRFRYLHALTLHSYEDSKKYHGQLVELYADFAPEKLMSFLQSSDHYPIQVILKLGISPIYPIFHLIRQGLFPCWFF